MKILQINKSAIDDFAEKYCPNGCTIPSEVDGITVCYNNLNKVVDYEMYDSEDNHLYDPKLSFDLDRRYDKAYDDIHRLFNYAFYEVSDKRAKPHLGFSAKVYSINHLEDRI